MSNNRVLGYTPPLQGAPPRHVIAADIETDGLGGKFIMGAMLPERGTVSYYTDPGAMIRALIVHKYYG